MNHYFVHLLSCLFLGNLYFKKMFCLKTVKTQSLFINVTNWLFKKRRKYSSVKLTAKKQRNANVVKNHTLDSVTTNKLNLWTNIIHSRLYLLFSMLNRSVLFLFNKFTNVETISSQTFYKQFFCLNFWFFIKILCYYHNHSYLHSIDCGKVHFSTCPLVTRICCKYHIRCKYVT